MRYLKEKNIYNYYMDSESSQEIKIPDIGKINIIGNNDSTAKKIESSDTDYYLGLLANKNKLNDDDDLNSILSSSEELKKSTDSDDSSSSDNRSRSSRKTESVKSYKSINRSPRSTRSPRSPRSFTPAPFSGNHQNENALKESRLKKIELLRKLSELKSKGYDLSKAYDFNSSVEEMEYEFELLKSFANKRNGIKLFKSCLCNGISIAEMLNDKYDPFEFQLSGWSEHMSVEVDSYEEVLEELYEKYKGTGKSMPPELKLLFLIVASASAFHFSKSTFKNLPGVDQALRNNPDLFAKMLNPKKEPSQFQTQQEIHLQRQKEIAIDREKADRQYQQPMVPPSLSHLQPQSTRQSAPVLKAPSNVQDILKRLHGDKNQNLDNYVTNNSETQESSSNNDRIVGVPTTSASDKKNGRKKKQIMSIL